MVGSKSCIRCGGQYAKPEKLSQAQWAGRKYCSKRCSGLRRSIGDRQIMAAYNEGRSSSEIAAEIGISSMSVRRAIKRAGGNIRPLSSAVKISHNRPDFREACRQRSTGRKLSEAAKDKLRALNGPRHHAWKGGVTNSGNGYLAYTNSPANGENAGRTVHRVEAEKKVGRRLQRHEHVHHKDHDKKNNHPSNLAVLPASEHHRLHALASGLGRRKQNAE